MIGLHVVKHCRLRTCRQAQHASHMMIAEVSFTHSYTQAVYTGKSNQACVYHSVFAANNCRCINGQQFTIDGCQVSKPVFLASGTAESHNI